MLGMATIKDFRDERIRKLNNLRQAGIDPYPAHSKRNTKIIDILDNYQDFVDKNPCVAGRILSIRSFGKLAFLKIADDSSANQAKHPSVIQIVLRGDDARFVKNLDTGDFIEAEGKIGKTKTGEISVFPEKGLRLLTKTLRPLPGRDGFTNKEERFRRRYVDMAVHPEIRERFKRRSIFWDATRDYLKQAGFIEVNIPVLETTTGGADANPFVTHMDALDEDYYLRISHELPLKRLLGAGFERVFDIGPRFRNEGISEEHLPEHVAMEAYAAYQDYQDGMAFYEEMIKYVCDKTWSTLQFKNAQFSVDLSGKWPRYTFAEILKQHFDIDVFHPDIDQLKSILKSQHQSFDENASAVRLLDAVWKIIRKKSAGPFWLIHEPVELSPLAKKHAADPRVTERFHPVIFGTEMGNGFSELNDPLDQLERFEVQQAMRDAGDDEAHMLDRDFVEMLEYGMPPACGWGNSERNFWLLEGVTAREGVPFPPMKRRS